MPEQLDRDVNEKLSRLVAELRRRGLRITAQRLAIAKIVFENIKEHPSFMQVLEKVRSTMPGISPSTVYNNLQLLEQLGLLKSFDAAGETRYDDVHEHVNVVCLDTGKAFDIDDEELLSHIYSKVKSVAPSIRVRNIVLYAECGASEPG